MIGSTGCTCLVARLGVLVVRFVAVEGVFLVDVVDARAVDALGFAVPLSVAVVPLALVVVDACSLGAGRLMIFDVGLTMPTSCARTCS